MGRIINTIVSVIYGLAPIAVVSIFGLAIYQQMPNLTGLTIIGTLGLLSIWLGVKIYFLSQSKGALNVISSIYSAPDIDEFVEQLGKEEEKIKNHKH